MQMTHLFQITLGSVCFLGRVASAQCHHKACKLCVRPMHDATERSILCLFNIFITQYKFKLLQLYTSQPSLYIDTTLIKRGLRV